MAHTLNYPVIFQQELDKAMVASAVTGWMEANAGQIKYAGGREVKIPKMVMDGLADYDKANGFTEGDIVLEYETMAMTQDRGRGFTLDAMDVNETNFVANAGMVMGEFQRLHVVPEVDAYRLSKLYTLADTRKRTYTPAVASVLTELNKDIGAVQEMVGSDIPLVVHIAGTIMTTLTNSTELSKKLDVSDFARGDVTTKVKSINGIPLLSTPSSRMKTAFTFYAGKADEEGVDRKKGGFLATATAKDINWIIVARNVPIAVSRTDTVRVFTPEQYQRAHAWHTDYRKYHDLWVTDNKLDGIFCNIGA
jgi:hypothetical protein